jgi:hypothetical protein
VVASVRLVRVRVDRCGLFVELRIVRVDAVGRVLGRARPLALRPVACWSMNPPPPPQSPDDKASFRATRSLVRLYQFSGALSFVKWSAVVAQSLGHYRLDVPRTLVGDLWMNAHDFVRFMTVDTAFLYLRMLAYVGYAETSAVPTTLLRTLVLGPGAALAVTLADLEPRRSPLAKTKQN